MGGPVILLNTFILPAVWLIQLKNDCYNFPPSTGTFDPRPSISVQTSRTCMQYSSTYKAAASEVHIYIKADICKQLLKQEKLPFNIFIIWTCCTYVTISNTK